MYGVRSKPSATAETAGGPRAARWLATWCHASLRLALGLVLLGGVAAAATPTPAQAMELRTGDAVNVPTGTTIDDDLLAASQTVTIAGQVTGDAYAFGQSVLVTGTIERDLIAAGQQVTVDGVIKGDLRTAGQAVVINGRVEGNVTGAGQIVTLGREGQVGGSILGAAQDLSLLGPVGRGVMAGGNSLRLADVVGGNVQAAVETLAVEPAARIAGRLDYTSPREAIIPADTVVGGVQYRQAEHQEQPRGERRDNPFGGLFSFFGLAWLIGSVLAGVLLVHFLPGFATGTAAQVRERPLASLGIGILALFVVPFAALIVALTVIGLPLSLLVGLSYLVALYLGQLLLGLAVGGLLVEGLRRGGTTARLTPEWLVVLGLVMLYVLTHLPWIGGLATFLALCLGLGALLRQLAAMRRRHPAALPPIA